MSFFFSGPSETDDDEKWRKRHSASHASSGPKSHKCNYHGIIEFL